MVVYGNKWFVDLISIFRFPCFEPPFYRNCVCVCAPLARSLFAFLFVDPKNQSYNTQSGCERKEWTRACQKVCVLHLKVVNPPSEDGKGRRIYSGIHGDGKSSFGRKMCPFLKRTNVSEIRSSLILILSTQPLFSFWLCFHRFFLFFCEFLLLKLLPPSMCLKLVVKYTPRNKMLFCTFAVDHNRFLWYKPQNVKTIKWHQREKLLDRMKFTRPTTHFQQNFLYCENQTTRKQSKTVDKHSLCIVKK